MLMYCFEHARHCMCYRAVNRAMFSAFIYFNLFVFIMSSFFTHYQSFALSIALLYIKKTKAESQSLPLTLSPLILTGLIEPVMKDMSLRA